MSILEEAKTLDQQYPNFKHKFNVPTFGSLQIKPDQQQYKETDSSVYFCGNSLGLMPKQTRKYLADELDAWSNKAVEAHFDHPKTCWMNIDLPVVPLLAPLVGAKESEVGVMNTLTSNLNSLLTVFYQPVGKKSKIVFDKGAFPSDYYAFLNQIKLHKRDIIGESANEEEVSKFRAEDHLLQLSPKPSQYHLQTEDILEFIDAHNEEIALLCLPGIQYYTGQYFEIDRITAHAKKYNLVVGWDLAHVVGNVPLQLHDWNVDFACWCTYKYLNAGPGGIGGFFINEKFSKDVTLPRLAGWWGNNETERFQMKEIFNPIQSALGFRQSNPSVLDVVSLQSSLDVYKSVSSSGDMNESIQFLRQKSIQLTTFLEKLLKGSKYYVEPKSTFPQDQITKPVFTIITPSNANHRGAQLSLLFFPLADSSHSNGQNVMEYIFNEIRQHGIIGDERRPNVIRLAPTPLYNTFKEVVFVAEKLEEAFQKLYK